MPLPTSQNLNNMSAALVTILTAVKDPSAPTEAAFTNIYEYPTNAFDGTPSVTIYPAGAPSEYQDVADNLRGYGFFVCIYIDLTNRNYAQVWPIMRQLVDATLDAIDRSIDLNATADLVRATPLDWFLEEPEQGSFIVCPLKVEAFKRVQIQ